MPKGGCRDCSRCTETGAQGCLAMPWRIVWAICFSWWAGAFTKKCPQCGHPIRNHHRRKDGSFQD
ncbi:MAG: hypothetical protein WC683_08215 [bacterium]